MSCKNLVLRVHPSAFSKPEDDGWKIYLCHGQLPDTAIGQGPTEESAWYDAAYNDGIIKPPPENTDSRSNH
jgi:hypothetical protein